MLKSCKVSNDVTTDVNKDKSGDDLTALQVTFNGMKWYIIADDSTAVDAGTVTLLAAESLGTSKFHGSDNFYSTSTIKTFLYDIGWAAALLAIRQPGKCFLSLCYF